MHHAVVERWSRGSSLLHRRDPRAKVAVLLVFLVVLASAHHSLPAISGGLLLLLILGLRFARVPVMRAIAGAAVVLPFTLVFAAALWLSGDLQRGLALVMKAYLSALAVLVVIATTPIPLFVRGLETTGAPRFLLMIAQFLYRYLFVISEEAQHMAKAAASRGATVRGLLGRRARFHAAAGALAVLFARSYSRAEGIHKAMLARGFSGRLPTLGALRFRAADAGFLVLTSVLLVLLRAIAESVTL